MTDQNWIWVTWEWPIDSQYTIGKLIRCTKKCWLTQTGIYSWEIQSLFTGRVAKKAIVVNPPGSKYSTKPCFFRPSTNTISYTPEACFFKSNLLQQLKLPPLSPRLLRHHHQSYRHQTREGNYQKSFQQHPALRVERSTQTSLNSKLQYMWFNYGFVGLVPCRGAIVHVHCGILVDLPIYHSHTRVVCLSIGLGTTL